MDQPFTSQEPPGRAPHPLRRPLWRSVATGCWTLVVTGFQGAAIFALIWSLARHYQVPGSEWLATAAVMVYFSADWIRADPSTARTDAAISPVTPETSAGRR